MSTDVHRRPQKGCEHLCIHSGATSVCKLVLCCVHILLTLVFLAFCVKNSHLFYYGKGFVWALEGLQDVQGRPGKGCEYLLRDQLRLQACALLAVFGLSCFCVKTLCYSATEKLCPGSGGHLGRPRTSTLAWTHGQTCLARLCTSCQTFILLAFMSKKWKTCLLCPGTFLAIHGRPRPSTAVHGRPQPSTAVHSRPRTSGRGLTCLARLCTTCQTWPFLPLFYSVLTETITNWRPPHIRGCAATPPYRNSI